MEKLSKIYRRIVAVQEEIKRLDKLNDKTFNDVITIHEERLKKLIDKTTVYRINWTDNKVMPGDVSKN